MISTARSGWQRTNEDVFESASEEFDAATDL